LALLERNLKQAEVPDNCIALLNTRGTAPGMWFEQEGKIIVSMPGIPYEMQGMMLKDVLPALKKHFKLPAILHRSLTTFGMAESMVAERLISFEKSLPPHISLAYLPGKGLLKLRLSARSDVEQRAAYRLDQYFGELESILSDITLTNEDIPPEVLIGNLLKEKKLTMATAESCTGGYLAHLITSVPGNSLYYKGTIVSYAVEVKNDLLKVPQDILKKDGVVSEATVKAMVKGVLRLIEADVAMSVSGYMGPDGGEPGKPVGTVWIAAGSRDKILTKEYHLRYDRARNIEITANYVLILLKQFIDQHNDHQ
jgi:nicotinamide-nucleotide amidase